MRLRVQMMAVIVLALSASPGLGAERAIRIATPMYPSVIGNPYAALSLPAILPSLTVFDPLVVIDRDGIVTPWLAETWASEDSLTWTVTLRANVRFSNGAALTSEALVASFEHMRSAEGLTETVGSNLAAIESVHAIDELTAVITLKGRDALFPHLMALWRIPEPGSWRDARPDTMATAVAGSGPFVIRSASASKIVLEPNPYAWHPPRASGLTIEMVPDQVGRLQAFTSGAIDLALAVGVGDAATIEAAGGRTLRRLGAVMPYIGFAVEHDAKSPLRDARVRQALNYAVDRAAIASILLAGKVEPVAQLALPGAAGYDLDLKPYPHDIERARELLSQAGFENGLDLTLRVVPVGPDDTAVYQQVANDLRAANVRVDVQTTPIQMMTGMLFSGDFRGAALFSIGARGLNPLADYRVRSCLGLTGDHRPFFCDTDNIATFVRARDARTADEAAAIMRDAIRHEYDNPPGIFLWTGLALDAVQHGISAGDGYTSYYDFLPMHELAIDAE